MKKMRLGIIGVGHMGRYHVNIASSLDNYLLVGIHDIDVKQAHAISEKFSVKVYPELDDLLRIVDAVVVAVTTPFHYEVATRALEFGCHVLIEKPITQTLAQAEEICNLALQKKLLLQVGHVERFNGAVLELSKIIDSPIFIQARRHSFSSTRSADIGVVLDLMIHDIDIVCNLVNSPVEYFSAIGTKVLTQHEDLAVLNLGFENGCVSTLTASRCSQLKERTLDVVQKECHIHLDYDSQDIEIRRKPSFDYDVQKDSLKYSKESTIEQVWVLKENPLRSEHLHFYNCVMGIEKPMVSNSQDISILKLALSCLDKMHIRV